MRSPLVLVFLSATLAFPAACSKSKPEQQATEEESEMQEVDEQEQEPDSSELGTFKKSKKKKRSKKKTRVHTPPTRQEGLEALEEGRMLIEEAEFVSAERQLRIAAAAGVEGGDKMLLRVRSEMAAEQLIVSAQKKIAAKDFAGARADLSRVPGGLILSDFARQTLSKISAQEDEARRELTEKINKRLEVPDAGADEAAAQEPAQP